MIKLNSLLKTNNYLLFLLLFSYSATANVENLSTPDFEKKLEPALLLAEPNWLQMDFQSISHLAPGVAHLLKKGHYESARETLLQRARNGAPHSNDLLWQAERIRRIQFDYNLTLKDIWSQLQNRIKDVTLDEFEKWISEGRFDFRYMNGEWRFLYASVSNLYFQHEIFRQRDTRQSTHSFTKGRAHTAALLHNTPGMLDGYSGPRRFKARMQITIPARETNAGDTIRAWMPFPRGLDYQHSIELLDVSPSHKHTASNNAPHRSLYFLDKAQDSTSTVFAATFAFSGEPRYNTIDPKQVKNFIPYDVLPYTLEEKPHINFHPDLVKLSHKLAEGKSNHYHIARAMYDWICQNVHYRYAREYSTTPNISHYVYQNRFGDCGQLALLFITLCRIQGIPAQWESGWMIYPEAKNLHDWTRIYLHPYGWIPVDPNFGMAAVNHWEGITKQESKLLNDFYFGNLSPYRFIVNHGQGKPHIPTKRFFRSDNVDFQRGEVETQNENLYFGRFSYDLDILSDQPAQSKDQ